MLMAVDLVVIVLARQEHASPATIGILLAFGGVGGIAGSLVVGRLQRRFSFAQLIITTAWLWALLWPLYAISPNLVTLGAITAALFVVWPVYNVVQMSYRVALIPDHLQGRVNSAFRIIAFTGQPVGMVLSGGLIQAVGPRTTVLLLALAPLAMAIAASISSSVRNARPLAQV
jgi:predicted MFS family arabinose efflux permease